MNVSTETRFCLCCRRKHAVQYVEREEQVLYKGAVVTYTARYKYCVRAEELLNDTEVLAQNYLALERACGERDRAK